MSEFASNEDCLEMSERSSREKQRELSRDKIKLGLVLFLITVVFIGSIIATHYGTKASVKSKYMATVNEHSLTSKTPAKELTNLTANKPSIYLPY